MYQKHYYDVIVFFHSCVPGRETDRHIFYYYGTPGSGRLFLKDAENEKSQSHGATVLRALKRFLLWYDLTLGNNKMLHITTCVDLKPIELEAFFINLKYKKKHTQKQNVWTYNF